jgi:DNA primase
MEVLNDYSWSLRRKEEGMSNRGYSTKQANTTQYAPNQVKSVLRSVGINISHETNIEIGFFCPFHNNTNSPSCSINKESGAWICFNPSCGENGTLTDIVKRILDKNDFQAIRYIMSDEFQTYDAFEDTLNEMFLDKPDFEEFSQETLDRLHADLAGNKIARDYLESRGINTDSMKHFALGYSNAMNMVVTPVHSPDGIPVGIVGRSIEGKSFKNSTNLPKNKTLFNIHRAKRIGDHVVVVESNFDAIRVHQAGFPNVIATLGGHISDDNIKLLNRYFNNITIMTDADTAGRELGKTICYKLRNKNLLWASCEYGKIYPHDAKDAGDMTDEEIKLCIKNAVSDIEYRSWNL